MRVSWWWAKVEWSRWGVFPKGITNVLNLLGRLVGVRDGKVEWHHSEISSGC
jgi:hypothetical protein